MPEHNDDFAESASRALATLRGLVPAALLVLPLVGCAAQVYEPRPVYVLKVAADLQARSADDEGLRAFMAEHGRATDVWPPPEWDLGSLTLMAIYYHPDMEVARARLELQRAAEVTAGQRPNPRITPLVEHHSEKEDFSDSPWSLGFALDIPIERADWRAARRAQAEALTEEARLDIAATAWRVRSRLRTRMIDSFAALESAELLRRDLDVRQRYLALLEKRQTLGEASPTEVSLARLQLQEARLALQEEEGNIEATRAALADALGMSLRAVHGLDIRFDDLARGEPRPPPGAAVEMAALMNRLDIRQAEARYAAAEAALKEQIAKQYPSFDLSPGFLWDQGDAVKSLAATVLLPVLNRNEGPIAEARATRDLESARFTAVQAQVMGEISLVVTRSKAAVRTWSTAKELVAGQRARLEQLEKLLAFGETDRLTLVAAEIELVAAERAQLQARIAALRALGAVEDTVQRPFEGGAPFAAGAPRSAPAFATARAKEGT